MAVNGWRINTVTAGNGPPILFLHGIGQSWQWWRPVMSRLSRLYTVCAIDLPGCGASSPLTSRPDPASYTLLVDNTIESLGLGPAVVVGHSLGGYIAANAATNRAQGIKALMLVDSGGFGPVRNRILRLLSWPVIGEVLVSLDAPTPLLYSMVHHRQSITHADLEAARLSPLARSQFLYQLRLGLLCGRTTDAALIPDPSPLTIPALIVWGNYDTVFPVEQAHRAQRVLRLPTSPVIFDESGHWPPHEEATRFDNLLRRFCEGSFS